MAPSTITITSEPSVSPIPLFTDCPILSMGIPSNNPARIETNKKERNGFTLPQVINRIRQAMHSAKMRMVMRSFIQSFGLDQKYYADEMLNYRSRKIFNSLVSLPFG